MSVFAKQEQETDTYVFVVRALQKKQNVHLTLLDHFEHKSYLFCFF